MKRTGVAGFVVALLFFSGTALAQPTHAWIAPHTLVVQLGRSDVQSVNRTFRRDGTGGPLDGPIRRGQIVGFASLDRLRDLAPWLAPGTWVMYDLERWYHTPAPERIYPYQSMRRFVAGARNHGLVAVLAPGGHYRDKAANLDADVFLAQVQNIMDPAEYRAKVCDIAERFDGPVYAELTANGKPGHHVTGLMRQWRAGRSCTSRFALWGGVDPASVAVAQDFLERAH